MKLIKRREIHANKVKLKHNINNNDKVKNIINL